MWKWIIGAVLALVLLVAGLIYVQYRKITSAGASAAVTMPGTPERVFASLADADSMSAWMTEGNKITGKHHGMVAAGDTLRIETGKTGGQKFSYLVSQVEPGQLLVMQIRSDSTGFVFATRRDSLVATGDSTTVVSTIASPTLDSLKTERGDTGGKVGGALLSFTSKMSIALFRALSEQDLRRLKTHLEGKKLP